MEETPNLDAFVGIRSLLRVTELHHQLSKPLFLLKDVNVAYRTVLHWDQQGLLEHSREESEWRRYDYIQFIWIKIINDLRTFGIPIPIIEKVKKEILGKINLKWIFELLALHQELLDKLPHDESKEELLAFIASKEYENIDESLSVSLLELIMVETLTSKVPASLILFSNGYLITLFENILDALDDGDRNRITYETHVKVSVTNILKTFLADSKESFLIAQLAILPATERKLLEMVQSGEYESIKINFKERKIKSLELTKDQNVKRRIVDILQDGKYQDIVIKTHKGIVTKIQNTVKIRLD